MNWSNLSFNFDGSGFTQPRVESPKDGYFDENKNAHQSSYFLSLKWQLSILSVKRWNSDQKHTASYCFRPFGNPVHVAGPFRRKTFCRVSLDLSGQASSSTGYDSVPRFVPQGSQVEGTCPAAPSQVSLCLWLVWP